MKYKLPTLGIIALILVLLSAFVVPVMASTTSEQLRRAVTLSGVRAHQAKLQSFADANGGTRTSGTPGYDASAQYVFDTLSAAGYKPTYQEFQFPFFQELSPSVL